MFENITIDQILSAIGHIATWVTVILVYLTLREMEKQRKTSYKPDLIIPKIPLYGYTKKRGTLFVPNWYSTEHNEDDEEIDSTSASYATLYNIGLGTAKDIKLEWRFDIQKVVNLIKEYCYENSIPIVVKSRSALLEIEFDGYGLVINLLNSSASEHDYLLSTAVVSSGLTIPIPLYYTSLVSLLTYIWIHKTEQRSSETLHEAPSIPSVELLLSYQDVANNHYTKKFHGTFSLIYIEHIKQDKETKKKTAQGMLEFRQVI